MPFGAVATAGRPAASAASRELDLRVTPASRGNGGQQQSGDVGVRQVAGEVDLITHAVCCGDMLQLLAQFERSAAGHGVAFRTTDQQQLDSEILRPQRGDRGDEPVEGFLRMEKTKERDE